MKIKLIVSLLAFLSVILTSCAIVPQSNPSEDTAAKTFQTNPKVANLYIYRDRKLIGFSVGWSVILDGRTLAVLARGTYILAEVEPGQHTLASSVDVSSIHLVAGHNYFVHYGTPLSPSETCLRQVSEQEGRAEISKFSRVITLY